MPAPAAARMDGGSARGVLDAGSRRDCDRRRAHRPDGSVRPQMILLSGADLVLPDRVLGGGTLVIEGDRIVEVRAPGIDLPFEGDSDAALRFPFADHYIVPGFIDVHVHGIEGTDALDGGSAIVTMAERLPRYGVTAFCPTSLACDPPSLRRMLSAVRSARTTRPPGGARVLPAHLESNFLNPQFKGAQPLDCLRLPPKAASRRSAEGEKADASRRAPRASNGDWTGEDILNEIAAARPDVGIVTMASEIDGGLELIRELVSHGHHVSLGHSGATYAEAQEGIRAGARQATHMFNAMTPLSHRAPGLAGAVLESAELTAELICDGVHVHPAV